MSWRKCFLRQQYDIGVGTQLQRVKELMSRLSQNELREARDFASARLNSGLAEHTRRDVNASDMILEAISDVMRSNGLDMARHSQLKSGGQYKAFQAKVAGLEPFFRRAARNQISRRALAYFAVDLLRENMDRINVAVSARAMMNHIHRLPSVLDLAFPGYAASGLLHLVIRNEERRRRSTTLINKGSSYQSHRPRRDEVE
jgi:hypothetical protein